MISVYVKVEGVDEAIKKLRELPFDMERKTGKAAASRAAEIVLHAARSHAPVGPPHSKREKAGGYLVSSIVSKTRTSAKKGFIKAQAQAMAPHANLVEYGFNWKPNRRMKKGGVALKTRGSHTFRVEPSEKGGFLRNALYRNGERVQGEFVKAVQESLAKLGR